MTAETQLHTQVDEKVVVSEDSKSSATLGIQGDRHPHAPDCNGDEGDDDNSYVFVTRNDDSLHVDNHTAHASPDSDPVDFQNQDSTRHTDANAPSQVAATTTDNDDIPQEIATVGGADSDSQRLGDHLIDSEPSPNAVENQQVQVAVLDSSADSGNIPELETVLNVAESSGDINSKSSEDNLESTIDSGNGQEPRDAKSQLLFSKPLEVETIEVSSEAQQNLELADEFGGTQENKIRHSGTDESALQQTEVHKMSSEEDQPNIDSISVVEVHKVSSEEDQPNIDSASGVEVMVESQIPATISEESGSCQLENGGRPLEGERKLELLSLEGETKSELLSDANETKLELVSDANERKSELLSDANERKPELLSDAIETKSELLSDANENQETFTVPSENIESDVDQVLKAEKSGVDIDLPYKVEAASGSVLNVTKDHFPDPSANHCLPVTETKQSNEHGDDGEKPLEVLRASDNADSLAPAAGSMEAETDIGGRQVESVPNVTLKDKVEQVTTPCTEIVAANTHGIVKSTSEDVNNFAVESAEKVSDCNGDDEIGHRQIVEANAHGLVKSTADNVDNFAVENAEKASDFNGEKEIGHSEIVAANTHEIVKSTAEDVDSFAVENAEKASDVIGEEEIGHTEIVATNADEIIKLTTEDVDNFAIEIVEKASHFNGEEESGHKSSLTENVAATTSGVINQESEADILVSGKLDNSSPADKAKLENAPSEDVDVYSFSGSDSITNCSPDEGRSRTEFALGTADSEGKMKTFQGSDVHSGIKIPSVDVECGDMNCISSDAKMEFEVEDTSGISSEDVPCNDAVTSGNEVSGSSVPVNENLPNLVQETGDVGNEEEQFAGADVKVDDKVVCQESNALEKFEVNEICTSLPRNSSADVGVEPLTRPFHFLIRVPRLDDLKVREQIRQAQLLVEERTRLRDAFRVEIQKYKAICYAHAAEYDAAMSESRASKRLVKSKRAEIDSLQSVINKVKNAISVEDIDARIYNMEHMIEHETLPLKDEKQFIREIKQMKQLRDQLSSNMGSQDEVQQALNSRDQIEERLKILKKELESLKDSALKAEAIARAIERKYEDENKKLKEVQAKYKAADNVRQAAYAQLQSLRRELFEKNQQFRMYKDNAATANDYAAKRDREGLHHLCVNQVESLMDLWNTNNEFRKEYVRCNVRSTLRRLGTFDGRSLGPDDRPPALAVYGDERLDRLASNPAKSSSIIETEILEEGGQVKPVEDESADNKTKVKETEPKSQAAKTRKPEKPILGNGLATVSDRVVTDDAREMEHLQLKVELELSRKAEELRKEEDAAKLKEQRRLEEKVKALEALERKKRNAEKAQLKAELRAQKEAEQREKEREKRLRKKERRKGTVAEVPDGNNIGEAIPSSESLTETINESESKETPAAVSKRPQKTSQFIKQSKTKSIPPPLRNRSRRKMQQWMWVILTCLLVIALFLLGNIGFFSNLSTLRRRSSGF